MVPEERRGGVARALMQGLARECEAKGYKRIDLNVLDWNPARGFYEKIGFHIPTPHLDTVYVLVKALSQTITKGGKRIQAMAVA